VKRLLILLVLLAGGVAAAALAIPSNAAVVEGVAISQNQLNTDVTQIANSHDGLYGCFLNAEELVGTNGQTPLPPIRGVGQGAEGTPLTATTGFTASYLDTIIGHQVVYYLAQKSHLVVTSRDLTTARSELIAEITSIMQDVSGTQYACAGTGVNLTGTEVLDSMPSSFIAEQVRFDATISVLEESVAGVGASTADLEQYFNRHSAEFDTTCFTVAGYSSASDAQAAAATVKAGTPFAQVASAVAGGGPQGCDILYGISQQLPAGTDLGSLALNTVSAPISYNGSYLLVEITKRTPTPFATAKSQVQSAVQTAGSAKAGQAVNAAEKLASVSVNPRYGKWNPGTIQVIPPTPPPTADVCNPAVDTPATTSTTTAFTSCASPATGKSG